MLRVISFCVAAAGIVCGKIPSYQIVDSFTMQITAEGAELNTRRDISSSALRAPGISLCVNAAGILRG